MGGEGCVPLRRCRGNHYLCRRFPTLPLGYKGQVPAWRRAAHSPHLCGVASTKGCCTQIGRGWVTRRTAVGSKRYNDDRSGEPATQGDQKGCDNLWRRVLKLPLRPLPLGVVLPIVALVMIVVIPWVSSIAALSMVPHHERLNPEQLAKAVAEERRNFVAIMAAIGAAFSLVFTALRHRLDRGARDSDREARELDREARRHDREANYISRYTTAIEQLDATGVSTRLGAIYALGRISRESPDDSQMIINVLCAWLQAPLREVAEPVDTANTESIHVDSFPMSGFNMDTSNPRASVDREAALKVIADAATYFPNRRISLNGADLSGVRLNGGDLTGASLEGADLSGAILTEVNLRGAILTDCIMSNARLEGVNLDAVNLDRASADRVKFYESKLRSSRLAYANLTNAEFRACTLNDATLDWARMSNCRFSNTTARSCSFWDVDLRGARLGLTDFSGTRFTRSNLTGAFLNGAVLTGALFGGAKLSGVSSDHVEVGSKVLFEDALSAGAPWEGALREEAISAEHERGHDHAP